MPHPGVAAGTVLAGRYRLEDLSAESAGARRWRAVDEVLARSVSVEVLPDDDPRAPALLEAARRSSVVADGRFVHVLDAFDESGAVVVVREWIPGQPLDVMLADGPLSHRRAAWITRECASALAAAHDLGIAHLCLVPSNVSLTASGGVKIAGLATDAALAQLSSDDPQSDDVAGLGRLLYACLVARWPGGPTSGLSAAPTENGRTLRPRQVRAGVPRPLDALCAGIISPANGGRPPESARAVSVALAAALDALAEPPGGPAADRPAPALLESVIPAASDPVQPKADSASRTTADLVAPPVAAPGAAAHEWHAGTTVQQLPVLPAADPRRGSSAVPGAPAPWRRWLLWLAVAVLVVGAGLLAYQLGRSTPSATDPPDRTSSPTSSGPTTEPLEPVPVSAVSDFDPVVDGGNGEENPQLAPLALDRDPQTAWTTVTYFDKRPLGGQKPGIGLVLDLGSAVPVREVKAALVGTGTDVQLRAAPRTAATVPTTAADFATVASVQDAGAESVFRLGQPVTTRYLLIYLTALPLVSPGNYQGGVGDVAVRG